MSDSFLPQEDGKKRPQLRLYTKAMKGLRIRDVRSTRLARKLMGAAPWLQTVDGPMTRAFAQLETLAEEAYAKIRLDGLVNPETGAPHKLLTEYRSLRRVQAGIAAGLGFLPRDRESMQAISAQSALDRIDNRRVSTIIEQMRSDQEAQEAHADGDAEPSDQSGTD
jgi:hypothetical protein